MEFDGVGAGNWSFVGVDESAATGLIEEYFFPQGMQLFGIPQSGLFLSPANFTYARSLAAREVVIFFDKPIGPSGIEAIQPQLSFHTATSGWYNGPVNANFALPGPFRGTFVRVPAAP